MTCNKIVKIAKIISKKVGANIFFILWVSISGFLLAFDKGFFCLMVKNNNANINTLRETSKGIYSTDKKSLDFVKGLFKSTLLLIENISS